MRLLLTILIIAIAAGITEWFAPWWSAGIVAGIGVIAANLRPGKAALAGFYGVALLWLAFALYRDISNSHILSAKLAALFHLPNYILYILATMIIGGLVGALPAWAAAHLRLMIRPTAAS